MGFNFPSSPTDGQVFPPFVYNAAAGTWRRFSGTALSWNRIVNPAMQISQQNADTAGTAAFYYAADQWDSYLSLTGAVVSFQRVQSVTPKGSVNRLRASVTTAQASLGTSFFCFEQKIEGTRVADLGWGTAAARQIVIRFGWKSPAGTYSVALGNGAQNRGCCVSFTVSAGEANTDIEKTVVFPGDVTGAWPATVAVSLRVYFTIAVEYSSYLGVSGVWQDGFPLGTSASTNGLATMGNTFELFDVGLYADPYKTGIAPEFEVPDYTDDLTECQRYWYRATNVRGLIQNATGTFYVGYPHPVPMRSIPSSGISGATLKAYDGSTAPYVTSVTTGTSTTTVLQHSQVNAGSLVIGRLGGTIMSDANQYVAVNARM